MSFYNVTNPERIVRSDPSYRVNKNISFLQSGFQQPDADNSDATVPMQTGVTFYTYTAQNLINRYLERTGNSGEIAAIDFLPSAFEIIHTLNQNQSIHSDSHLFNQTPVRKGFYFDFHIYNETPLPIRLAPGEGVSFGFLPTGPWLAPEAMGVYRCTVTNATPATGTSEVYINELSCCGYEPILFA